MISYGRSRPEMSVPDREACFGVSKRKMQGGRTRYVLGYMPEVTGGVMSTTSPGQCAVVWRAGEVRYSMAEITLAHARLGYKPQVSLAAGLREILGHVLHG